MITGYCKKYVIAIEFTSEVLVFSLFYESQHLLDSIVAVNFCVSGA